MYTEANFFNEVCGTVLEFQKNGLNEIAVVDIKNAVEEQLGTLHADAVDEIKRILENERERLDIREAAIGGSTWAFGYRPRASSRLIPAL
jgi:hypothetical protein